MSHPFGLTLYYSGGLTLDTPFYHRLNSLRAEYGESLVRTPTYETCSNFPLVLSTLKNRLRKVDRFFQMDC